MIKITVTNDMMLRLLAIEEKRSHIKGVKMPRGMSNRLRKSSRKKSSYASNKIEGNPLSEEQSDSLLSSEKRHFLKPEQEIRNYYLTLEYLEEKLKEKAPVSVELILDVQERIVFGASKDKIGLRGAMPPGVLFAVYDDVTKQPEYIPPEYTDVKPLLEELVDYVNTSSDHPVIKAAVMHYQMVTIHPFEDGNGRTARILSNYLLDLEGYDFGQIGSLDEFFAFDTDEYYNSLQMGLPPLYYQGRDNPPHPEIWAGYFLRMMELYAKKALDIALTSVREYEKASMSHLTAKEKKFLEYLRRHKVEEFRPIDIAIKMKVTNRTIINWCAALSQHGFLKPNLVSKRVVSYTLIA